jgi:hypothetical protein
MLYCDSMSETRWCGGRTAGIEIERSITCSIASWVILKTYTIDIVASLLGTSQCNIECLALNKDNVTYY